MILASVPAACQEEEGMQKQLLDTLEAKYDALNANAEYVTVNGVPVAQKIRFLEPEEELSSDFDDLRQIALIRHGEPDILKTGGFSYEEAKEYIKNYDSVGIMLPDEPFFLVDDQEEITFFSSSINRAHHTAQYLFGTDREMVVSPDFREFERVVGGRAVKMRLPLKYWTTYARIKWMLGFEPDGIESFEEARERAQKAALVLAEATEETPKVVLVAHGFMNRYIKKYLEKMGWRVVRDGGDNYFATTILARIEEGGDEQEPLITETND